LAGSPKFRINPKIELAESSATGSSIGMGVPPHHPLRLSEGIAGATAGAAALLTATLDAATVSLPPAAQDAFG
jgi:hypothetical protein